MGCCLNGDLVLFQGSHPHQSPQGGKTIHTLRSHMIALKFFMEPPVDCPDTNAGDVAFVKVTDAIRGRDAIEEFLECGLYSLPANFSLRKVGDGVTLVLKLGVPLPMFNAVHFDDEDDTNFLARVELEAENIVGSYSY
jgi:hypothetical protein